MGHKVDTNSDEPGATSQLCDWITKLTLDDVPASVRTRAKHLILDGLTCALVGARLENSSKATEAVLSMESPGRCAIIGWEKKIGPLPAALINSTFIQAFEIDDYHAIAPLHSNAIILPALLAAAEQSTAATPGAAFLLASIVGYEVGPRVGLGLWGAEMLGRGWHSGAVFGPSCAAAAVCKMLGLSADQLEDALGTACTQACGLMSAQFESDVKRMQHGFAARNGLFAALLSQANYKGIKKIYERPYGGFLATFGQGSKRDPEYRLEEVTKNLGTAWETDAIRVKSYSSCAVSHSAIDCVRQLQASHAGRMADPARITRVVVELNETMMKKGGWSWDGAVTAISAQMSIVYAVAVQLVDREVTPTQFRESVLRDPARLALLPRIRCEVNPDVEGKMGWGNRMTVTFDDGEELVASVVAPRGLLPPITNDEIVTKWRQMTVGAIDDARRDEIEQFVLNLEKHDSLAELLKLLAPETANVLA